MTVNVGHGRIEWRGIQVKEVTPEQMGFPHVVQLARIDRIRELKGGKQEVETVWIITSLTSDQADATRLLELVRLYWSIENGTLLPVGRERRGRPVPGSPPDLGHRIWDSASSGPRRVSRLGAEPASQEGSHLSHFP